MSLTTDFRIYILPVLYLLLFSPLNPTYAQEEEADVPYVPTPDTVLEQMMKMGNVGPGDYVIDLGSGDGRIPIAAARRGAFAHGIEIDSSLVLKARDNAREADVSEKTAFIHGDIFKQKIHQANVITMYLFPELMERLKDRLIDRLDPGTRVVSHLFNMDGWTPDQKFTIEPDFHKYLSDIRVTDTLAGLSNLVSVNTNAPANLFPEHDIFMWIIPADAEGTWSLEVENNTFRARIDQEYQQIDVSVRSRQSTFKTVSQNLRGRRISFAIQRGDVRYNFSGTIRGDSVEGIVQVHQGDGTYVSTWKGNRVR